MNTTQNQDASAKETVEQAIETYVLKAKTWLVNQCNEVVSVLLTNVIRIACLLGIAMTTIFLLFYGTAKLISNWLAIPGSGFLLLGALFALVGVVLYIIPSSKIKKSVAGLLLSILKK